MLEYQTKTQLLKPTLPGTESLGQISMRVKS